jgi:hypothetical protein
MGCVIALAGRRIDPSDAKTARFPLVNVPMVREQLTASSKSSRVLWYVRPPADDGEERAYAAANEAILREAQALAEPSASAIARESYPGAVLAVLVWDGRARGADDLTASFAAAARRCGMATREVATVSRGLLIAGECPVDTDLSAFSQGPGVVPKLSRRTTLRQAHPSARPHWPRSPRARRARRAWPHGPESLHAALGCGPLSGQRP